MRIHAPGQELPAPPDPPALPRKKHHIGKVKPAPTTERTRGIMIEEPLMGDWAGPDEPPVDARPMKGMMARAK